MSNRHKKLAQKCAVPGCGKEPAYYSKLAGNYVCITHSIHYIRKAMVAKAIIAVVAIITVLVLINS